jgi:O-antigen biosynthesis protein
LDLSIIIVNYNVKEFLQNLIHSIHKAAKNLTYEIIVVDNASDDGSVEFIREKFPEINLIANNENLGFSKANNIGLTVSKGKYLLLLNPDTLVREDTFTTMINFFENNPDAGLAGCKILNPDGTLQLACRRSFPGPWTSFCKVTGLSNLFPKSKIFARYNLSYLDENQTYEVDAISGSFMMFPRKVYEKIGGLDEQFFMYGEDLDFCYRIQKAGFKVFYVHSTQIIHYKGESTKRSSLDETKHFYNAMHLFVKKHLASSFMVELILRSAIAVRSFIAFWGKRKLILTSILFDFIFFNITLLAAEQLYNIFRPWYGFPAESIPVVFTVPALLHITVAGIIGVYRTDSLSLLKNISAVFLSFFLVSSTTFFFSEFAYSRGVIVLTYVLLIVTLTGWRLIKKMLSKDSGWMKDSFGRKVIVVGISENASNIAETIKEKSLDYSSVMGLISISGKDIGKNYNGFEVIGSIENINKIIKYNKISTVVFSSHELSYEQMMSVVSKCQDEDVEFKLIGADLDFLVGKASVSMLNNIPVIDVTYNISNPLHRTVKTVFDYLTASVVLIFFYPFIYLTAKLRGRKKDFSNFILDVPKIFTGKVSFVGPYNPSENKNLFLGKKGLTGLWYIENSSGRSDKLDIYYAKNQNLWLDLEILGRTINKMWNGGK